MPVLVATRLNPDLNAKCKALIAAENPAKVAITAAMRKLAGLTNAPLGKGLPWTPTPA